MPPAKESGQLDGSSQPISEFQSELTCLPLGNLQHTRSQVQTSIPEDHSDAKEKREDAKLAHKLELGESTTGISGYTDRGQVTFPFPITPICDISVCGKKDSLKLI